MKSIKRQAASKARPNKLQQGDSTESLSGKEKPSCDFRDNSKGPFCIFADIYAYEWAQGMSSAKKDCVMRQNVLVAYGEKDNTCRCRLVKYSQAAAWTLEAEREL